MRLNRELCVHCIEKSKVEKISVNRELTELQPNWDIYDKEYLKIYQDLQLYFHPALEKTIKNSKTKVDWALGEGKCL